LKTSDLNDLINDLMDLVRAGELRCLDAEPLVRTPPLKAHLLLCASGQAADAERLRELVVQFRGTPHDGATEARLADPILKTPHDGLASDRALLQSCIDDQSVAIGRLRNVLSRHDVSSIVRSVLTQCHDAAVARERVLTEGAKALSDAMRT
jgi:hypothetical protein